MLRPIDFFPLTLFALLAIPSIGHSAEENKSPTDSVETSTLSEEVEPKWPFSGRLDADQLVADEIKDITVKETTIPVLHYWSKGRIERGTVILLAAQGESPASSRLALPLSTQLSQLGWEVLVPTIPVADFIIEEPTKDDLAENNLDAPSQSTQQNSAANQTSKPSNDPSSSSKNDNEVATDQEQSRQTDSKVEYPSFFSTPNEFQEWFNLTIIETAKLRSKQNGTILLIGNQNSAYWLLDSTKAVRELTHIVLIAPENPRIDKPALNEKFSQQQLPVFAFISDSHSKNPFTRAFQQKKWNVANIRVNQGVMNFVQLDLENTTIAKMISGWITATSKSKN